MSFNKHTHWYKHTYSPEGQSFHQVPCWPVAVNSLLSLLVSSALLYIIFAHICLSQNSCKRNQTLHTFLCLAYIAPHNVSVDDPLHIFLSIACSFLLPNFCCRNVTHFASYSLFEGLMDCVWFWVIVNKSYEKVMNTYNKSLWRHMFSFFSCKNLGDCSVMQ